MSIRGMLFFVFIFLAGCAGPSIKTDPVTDLSAKETIASFSFLPPQELGWVKTQFAPNWINYLRKSEPDHTHSAWAKLIKLPEEVGDGERLLALMKAQRDADNDPKRFKVLVQGDEIDTSRKELCVRYHWMAEDHNAQRQTTSIDYLVLDAYGLICRHPYDKSLLVDFHYSERYKPGDDVRNLPRNANLYLGNVKFEGEVGRESGIAIRNADLAIADYAGQIGCGYHVLVEKKNDSWKLISISETLLDRANSDQEVLCVNRSIDAVAPDWSSTSGRQSGRAGDCTLVDGIDHAVKSNLYNECNSALASTSIGRSMVLNTLGFLATGSVGYSRVADRELIRRISEEVSLVEQVTKYKNEHKATHEGQQ